MAATRFTSPTSPLTSTKISYICPTCGRQRVLDGKAGMLQNPNWCRPDCYQRLRTFNLQREFLHLGAAFAATVSPITPGGVPGA